MFVLRVVQLIVEVQVRDLPGVPGEEHRARLALRGAGGGVIGHGDEAHLGCLCGPSLTRRGEGSFFGLPACLRYPFFLPIFAKLRQMVLKESSQVLFSQRGHVHLVDLVKS